MILTVNGQHATRALWRCPVCNKMVVCVSEEWVDVYVSSGVDGVDYEWESQVRPIQERMMMCLDGHRWSDTRERKGIADGAQA